MKLTVIGCAGSYPNPSSPASCYLIEHEGATVVLDLGSGSLGPLQEQLDPVLDPRFAAVILSHCHVDHCADFGSLYVMRHYGPMRPPGRLPLIGPVEAASRMANLYGMADTEPIHEEFDVQALGGTLWLGPFEITSVPARHPVEAYSIRVSAGGRSITYSGDTGPNPDLVELARGTDIALFETSFLGDGNPPDLHMSGKDAALAASQAGAGLLLATHLVAWNDNDAVIAEAAAHFNGPVERATAGMSITL